MALLNMWQKLKQTYLLLMLLPEAARTGEHGKGVPLLLMK